MIAAITVGVVVATDDTALRVGLFGLLGTLTGALTTYATIHEAAMHERRSRKRAAGRLLQEDLTYARARCANSEVNRKFWSPRFDLRFEDWSRYREIVSQEIDNTSGWQEVAAAFASMRALQAKCDGLRERYGERLGLGPESHARIDDYLRRSDAALEVLRQLSGDRPADEPPQADAEAQQ